MKFFDIIYIIILSSNATKKSYQRNEDFLFALAFSFLETFGGGLIRDLMLIHTSMGFLENDKNILVCIVSSIITYWLEIIKTSSNASISLSKKLLNKINSLIDTLATAEYIASGTQKGCKYDMSFPACVACGVSSGLMGGTLSLIINKRNDKIMIKRLIKMIFAFFIAEYSMKTSTTLFSNFIMVVFLHSAFFLIDNFEIQRKAFIRVAWILFPWLKKQKDTIVSALNKIIIITEISFHRIKKTSSMKIRKSVCLPIGYKRKSTLILL